MSERLERLVNLTATLLDTRRPLTLDELAERLEPRVPRRHDRAAASVRARQGDAARPRRADRGRDASTAFGGDVGYRIHPDDYYLPELGARRGGARRAPPRGHRGATSKAPPAPSTGCASSAASEGEGAGRALAELRGHARASARCSTPWPGTPS